MEEDQRDLKKKKRKRCNGTINNRKPVRGKPFAEYWIGTHESGPSYVVRGRADGSWFGSQGLSLKDWISEDPVVLLGERVAKKWGDDLPFLFKVISVEKALSIQAHPDKELARALHESHPILYKDDNHKPEMALALTEFEALCGFISSKELKGLLSNVPEIVELVGGSVAEQYVCVIEKEGEDEVIPDLKSIFSQVMSLTKGAVQDIVCKLKKRLQLEKKKRKLAIKEELVLRLESQYPADVGLIAAFFLNYVKLNYGEALYLGPNEAHAYISGECIECMTASDNVVRSGLTSKWLDIQTLLSMLKYKQGFPEILQGVSLNPYTKRYLPPFEEFEVDRCMLPPAASVEISSVSGLSASLGKE